MALSAASVVNRLRLVETLFHVFDLDNDGKITKEEIGKMLHTLVDVTNSNNKRRNNNNNHHHHPQQTQQNKQIILQKRIDDAFNELNTNDDDHITKDEFIEWYMKSGLISEVQTNEINVADSSRIQEISKKSRKLMKQTSYNKNDHEQEENRNRLQPLVRHISRMTERKSATYDDDDDERPTTISSSRQHNGGDIEDDRRFRKSAVRLATNTNDSDSHTSKENERWQHLFNSVLGQIRSQRVNEQQQQQQLESSAGRENGNNDFHSWKREGEEKLKSEYIRQKSDIEQNHSNFSAENNGFQPTTTISYQPSSNPDIVSIRL